MLQGVLTVGIGHHFNFISDQFHSGGDHFQRLDLAVHDKAFDPGFTDHAVI